MFAAVIGCGGNDALNGGNGGVSGNGGMGGSVTGNLVVSGALSIPGFVFVDGDTNDPSSPTEANDGANADDIQLLGNPAVVGGYLGRIESDQDVDVSDFYRVPLAAGQAVTLFGSGRAADFDLFLYRLEQDGELTLIDQSQGDGNPEQVIAPVGGEFIVEVFGCSLSAQCIGVKGGRGLYNLIIGSTVLLSQTSIKAKLSSQTEFVDGEVLLPENAGIQSKKVSLPDGWYRLDDHFDLKRMQKGARFERWELHTHSPLRRAKSASSSIADRVRPLSPTIIAVKRLRRSGISDASPNYIRRPTAIPDDEYYPLQWHYPAIGLPAAWDITAGTSDVVVAVIDTGVVLRHPDLENQLVPGYDFISDRRTAADGDGVDDDPNDPGDGGFFTRSSFHGTHVAGTVAADTNNQSGVAGVAWQARVMPVRVLGVGGGTDFDICQGMLFAAGLPNSAGASPTRSADVLNMSLGGEGFSPCMQDAVDQARAAGAIVVAAAGNDNRNSDDYSPAGLDGVIAVSATDYSNRRAEYSNFGTTIDVAAPGGDLGVDTNGDGYPDGVLSTIATDRGDFTYSFAEGTSMASPHVAGVIALMKAVYADLSPQDVDLLLAGTHPQTTSRITRDLGAPGLDQFFGHGLIDALAAVQAATELGGGTPIERPVILVEPQALQLTATQPSASVTVKNTGTGTLTVAAVDVDAPWLSVSPTSGGEGTYTIRADTTGLDDGLYLAVASFSSNGGVAAVTVRLIVGPPPITGGAVGTVYVILVDRFGKRSAQTTTSADRDYQFSMERVLPGTYRVFAGTDLDRDGLIDEPSEAVGAFPTLAEPEELRVSDDIEGLEFGLGFDLNLPGATQRARVDLGE